jgi:hypothetical protein
MNDQNASSQNALVWAIVATAVAIIIMTVMFIGLRRHRRGLKAWWSDVGPRQTGRDQKLSDPHVRFNCQE